MYLFNSNPKNMFKRNLNYKYMLIPYSIVKQCIYCIISPHGLTDFIHAKQFNIVHKLSQIYVGNLGIQYITSQLHIEYLYNIIFLMASAIHFRNDMPLINYNNKGKQYQLLLSSLLVSSFPYLSFDFFLLYMTCIHTPNHYKMSWSYINNNVLLTSGLLIATILFFYKVDFMNNDLSLFSGVSQSVIVSHIMYQEKFVFPDYNETISRYSNISIKIE